MGLACVLALGARRRPHDYAELLADAGIKAQASAPMIPIVKLVFGATYDKTRLTEYAAALDHALANMLESHALAAYLEQYAGGLKGLVRDMRQARRQEKPEAASRQAAARKKIRSKGAANPEEDRK